MNIAARVIGQDVHTQIFGSLGQIPHGHTGTVQVRGVAALVEGPGHAAHLLVAFFTADAGGDDDGLVKITPKRFDFLKQLGSMAAGQPSQ